MPENGGISMYADIWPFNPKMYDKSPICAWPHSKGNPSGPLVLNFKWVDATKDEFWIETIKTLTAAIKKAAVDERLTKEDAAAYYNLSIEEGVSVQDIYQENIAWLVKVKEEYDPYNVMGRTGGFRIPPLVQ